MNNDNKYFALFLFSMICCLSIMLSAALYSDSKTITRLEEISMTNADLKTTVKCISDSMGLVIRCGDTIYLSEFRVLNGDKLRAGDLYVFESPYTENDTTLHRLVWFNDSHALFKGDNNKIADPMIEIQNVKYKVVGVEYQ